MQPMAGLDGRVARSRRTRAAVIDALLALVQEGEAAPTAPRVAERAGVSLRSVYQHFGDVEGLFSELAEQLAADILASVEEIPASLPLDERIARFCDQRGRIFDRVTPIRRASLRFEDVSPAVRAARVRLMAAARDEIERVFGAELDRAPDRADVLDALDAATSWSVWDGMRTSGLDAADATAAMCRVVRALVRT